MYGLSSNHYRVAALPKSYLTDKEIIMQSVISIGQFQHVYEKKLTVPDV